MGANAQPGLTQACANRSFDYPGPASGAYFILPWLVINSNGLFFGITYACFRIQQGESNPSHEGIFLKTAIDAGC